MTTPPDSGPSARRGLPGWLFAGVLGAALAVLLLMQLLQQRSQNRALQPVISELQAANETGLRDETGRHTGWIELWNPTDEVIQLEGWALTDDFRHLHKWRFPAVRLLPGKFLVVFATGLDRTNPAALHTNFKLDPAGEYLALVPPVGDRVAQEFLPKFPRQIADTSFGLSPEVFGDSGQRFELGRHEQTYLLVPSPGAPNREEMLGIVADTRFSHVRGHYTNAFALAITTRTISADIRYTLDGTRPNATNGFVYEQPIPIARTTVVRAAAFRDGHKPSDVDTHTFIFPQAVLAQSGAGLPATWGEREGQPVTADYEMDPEIVHAPGASGKVLTGLGSLPSMSLTLPPADLFAESGGIYSHPLDHGETWERAGSIEWFQPAGRPDVQASCGVRIQGGWSRRPEESPKHSFRLVFRERYGDPELKHPLFGKMVSKRFHELILRGGSNNSWLHWSGSERARGDLLRDQWMRDTMRAMDQPAARGMFVHLYLNGLYWGIYNVVERPDSEFLAAAFGGRSDDYEARNGENVIAGDTALWDELFAVANAGLTNAENYQHLERLLDVPAFIDFMLAHLYGGSADMDRASNWYAGRPRKPGGRYIFLMWDGERTLENLDASSLALDYDQCPTRLFQKLRENPVFRAAFAARAKALLGPGGALSPELAARRYRTLATHVHDAMICESARWGDYRRDVHRYREGPYELYTVEKHWEPEVKRLLEEYFPNRSERVLAQLRAAGLVAD